MWKPNDIIRCISIISVLAIIIIIVVSAIFVKIPAELINVAIVSLPILIGWCFVRNPTMENLEPSKKKEFEKEINDESKKE